MHNPGLRGQICKFDLTMRDISDSFYGITYFGNFFIRINQGEESEKGLAAFHFVSYRCSMGMYLQRNGNNVPVYGKRTEAGSFSP